MGGRDRAARGRAKRGERRKKSKGCGSASAAGGALLTFSFPPPRRVRSRGGTAPVALAPPHPPPNPPPQGHAGPCLLPPQAGAALLGRAETLGRAFFRPLSLPERARVRARAPPCLSLFSGRPPLHGHGRTASHPRPSSARSQPTLAASCLPIMAAAAAAGRPVQLLRLGHVDLGLPPPGAVPDVGVEALVAMGVASLEAV